MILEPIDIETLCFRMAEELLLFPDCFQVLFWVSLVGYYICQVMSRALTGLGTAKEARIDEEALLA